MTKLYDDIILVKRREIIVDNREEEKKWIEGGYIKARGERKKYHKKSLKLSSVSF